MGPEKNFCFAMAVDVSAWHLTDTNTERYCYSWLFGLKQCFSSGGLRFVNKCSRIWVGSELQNVNFTSLSLCIFIISVSLLLRIGSLLHKFLSFFVAVQSGSSFWNTAPLHWVINTRNSETACWFHLHGSQSARPSDFFLQMKISPPRCLETSFTNHAETGSYIAEQRRLLLFLTVYEPHVRDIYTL
jgi:hypothetical protein